MNWGGYVALLTWTCRQAWADTAATPSHASGIETDECAARVREDAADFLASVQAAYIEIRDEAGAVMEVIARRRLAWPIVNEADTIPGEKNCSQCGERKETIEFYTVRRRGYATRLDSWCSECRRAYKRKAHGRLDVVMEEGSDGDGR